jgi:hypothetical protein
MHTLHLPCKCSLFISQMGLDDVESRLQPLVERYEIVDEMASEQLHKVIMIVIVLIYNHSYPLR